MIETLSPSQLLLEQQVLDYGYVKYDLHAGDDNRALVAARMSTENPTGVDESKDNGTRDYMFRKEHTSPFEMPDLTITLQIPIFVLRQLDRHRTMEYTEEGGVIEASSLDEYVHKWMSRNEFSGRYSVMPNLYYLPSKERIMGKDPKNKQGSMSPLPPSKQKEAFDLLHGVVIYAREAYEKLEALGVANEIARIILPMNQYTKIMLKGAAHNWFRFLEKRLAPEAQWEVRQYANAIARVVRTVWPKTWELFEEYTLYGAKLSRSEVAALNDYLTVFFENFGGYIKDKMGAKRGQELLEKLRMTKTPAV